MQGDGKEVEMIWGVEAALYMGCGSQKEVKWKSNGLGSGGGQLFYMLRTAVLCGQPSSHHAHGIGR